MILIITLHPVNSDKTLAITSALEYSEGTQVNWIRTTVWSIVTMPDHKIKILSQAGDFSEFPVTPWKQEHPPP